DPACLILGDNLYYGSGMTNLLKSAQTGNGATVFAYQVADPERYGVVEFNQQQQAISIEEKPLQPKSNFAVTGLYFYDDKVVEYAKQIKPSVRGELEITDLNQLYLDKQQLNVVTMKRGFAWLDTGTHDSLLEASNFIQTVEHRQGIKIACLEEIAWLKGWLTKQHLIDKVAQMGKSTYAEYLRRLVK
ncbi:MAG: glucose-phosphate thymidylyltransferase, partial [Pseudomonadota bacterium]